jgi:hypothetical protein
MGGACNTHGRDEVWAQILVLMALREIGWEIVDYVYLAQDRNQLQAVVNTVMNFVVT